MTLYQLLLLQQLVVVVVVVWEVKKVGKGLSSKAISGDTEIRNRHTKQKYKFL
jgi:hypothetical protein